MSAKLEKYLKQKLKGMELSEIADIVLFGSAVKGKEFPADLDICIIFRKKEDRNFLNEISSRLKDKKVHISTLTINNFFKKPHSLAKTILIEGRSILTGRSIISNFGFSSVSVYSYDLSKLSHSNKVRFVYLLKGRKKGEGIIKNLGGEWLADSCFLVPIEKDNEILSIFKKWEVDYMKKEVLVH